MFERVKRGLLRRLTSVSPEQEDDAARRKMPIQGLQVPAVACMDCGSTNNTVTKKATALPEEESLYSEAALRELLEQDPVPLDELCSLCRRGCPPAFRCEVWGYLTGNLQPFASSRAAVLARKRQEYLGYVQSSYGAVDWNAAFRAADEATNPNPSCNREGVGRGGNSKLASYSERQGQPIVSANYAVESELLMLKQIRKDVPRMSAGVAYLHHSRVMLTIERILYIWSLRHPACGYVQGLNDLVIPFISVVLASRFCPSKTVSELHTLTENELNALFSPIVVTEEEWNSTIEADTYWMFSYLLNSVQENYTYNQKGIYSMVEKLEAVAKAVDGKLYKHLCENLQISFSQFAFRWMNCMLLRELNATQSLRLWDVYLADQEKDWCTTHVYVCAALLVWWSPALCKENDYGVAMKFLQNLPTEEISDKDISALISQGIVMQKLYNNTLSHLA
ncbi:putative GTPase activating protein [Trypanosoma theileri]|uniref:Putative GTPase activating protein n=1 Tax=Trypanosoma theileri TaxID=67003 RepID=A0A1X0P2Z0_9TRYP|nr:putative GTPase activating protein [Trypanosoma theileri]ORC90929.1 putative GTPase activating protein [Trypanosoma theileri]